ncbi:MAG TPA: C39 family peptidase [Chitinophaga sp.]|uniref:C39 family peptidase n=1 Tax=Chitinophaga sp. TaxID=1869181 RepID=UPI002CC4F5B0|nr:C39 family peptidase [Chitinophaga sp.]HVI44969.1 C39 family peptidase [Chitinophaga sp.]
MENLKTAAGIVDTLPGSSKLLTPALSTRNLVIPPEDAAAVLFMSVPPPGQSNWAWLACIVGVHEFFIGNGEIPQCQLITPLLGIVCCGSNPPSDCNRAGLASMVLAQVNGMGRTEHVGNVVLPQVQNSINYKIPVILSYVNQQSQENGHAVVICGYDNNGNVYVIDPASGTSMVPFNDLMAQYNKPVSEAAFVEIRK